MADSDSQGLSILVPGALSSSWFQIPPRFQSQLKQKPVSEQYSHTGLTLEDSLYPPGSRLTTSLDTVSPGRARSPLDMEPVHVGRIPVQVTNICLVDGFTKKYQVLFKKCNVWDFTVFFTSPFYKLCLSLRTIFEMGVLFWRLCRQYTTDKHQAECQPMIWPGDQEVLKIVPFHTNDKLSSQV